MKKGVCIAFFSGAIFLSYELLWFRLFSFGSSSDPKVFGVVLSVYLSGLGIGAALFGHILKKRELAPSWPLAGLLMFCSSLICYLLIPVLGFLSSSVSGGWIYGGFFLLFACIIVGTVLPALLHASTKGRTLEKSGYKTGVILSVNTAGSVLGTLLASYVFMDLYGLVSLNRILCWTLLALSLFCFIGESGRVMALSGIAVLSSFALLFLGHDYSHNRLFERLFYGPRWKYEEPFHRVIENRHGIICQTSDGTVYGGGGYDGHISTSLIGKKNREIDHAYLALSLSSEPQDILEIGMASGAWLKVLCAYPSTRSVTAVEINPGYLEIIKNEEGLRSLLSDPKAEIVIDDGRRWLRHNPDTRFHLIVLNTTFHNRRLATNLLSEEFLREVKRHLRPGGSIYFNTTGSRDALKTVSSQFSHLLYRGGYCIASDEPVSVDRDRFAETLLDMRMDGQTVFSMENSKDKKALKRIVSLGFIDPRDHFAEELRRSRIITDDNMSTEF